MSTRAHIRDRFEVNGIDVAIVVDQHGGQAVRQWPDLPEYRTLDPLDAAEARMTDRVVFREDEARALYEALADHYGHGTNDTRALRRDYDAERSRVDLFIAHITGKATA